MATRKTRLMRRRCELITGAAAPATGSEVKCATQDVARSFFGLAARPPSPPVGCDGGADRGRRQRVGRRAGVLVAGAPHVRSRNVLRAVRAPRALLARTRLHKRLCIEWPLNEGSAVRKHQFHSISSPRFTSPLPLRDCLRYTPHSDSVLRAVTTPQYNLERYYESIKEFTFPTEFVPVSYEV